MERLVGTPMEEIPPERLFVIKMMTYDRLELPRPAEAQLTFFGLDFF